MSGISGPKMLGGFGPDTALSAERSGRISCTDDNLLKVGKTGYCGISVNTVGHFGTSVARRPLQECEQVQQYQGHVTKTKATADSATEGLDKRQPDIIL